MSCCLHQPTLTPQPQSPWSYTDSGGFGVTLESLPLKVLGEKLQHHSTSCVVGLQATGFSVKRMLQRQQGPRTEAHRYHLWETTAAGEEPMRAGRGLKAHGWKEDSWGRATDWGAVSRAVRPLWPRHRSTSELSVSDLCSKSEETVVLWARSDTKIACIHSS